MNDKQMSWEEAVFWLRSQPEMQDLVKFCFYDDPLSESAERYYVSTEWKGIQEVLSFYVTGTALDIGAGRGISSYALAKDGWIVTALEPDKSNLVGAGAIRRLAEENNLNIKVIESFGEKLPFQDNSFDLIFARQVLHHANNLETFCKEVYRVLKPKGVFMAIREHVISKKSDLQIFLENHPLHRFYGGENAFTLREYKKAFFKSGIKIKRILATYDSDINLFPTTKDKLKEEFTHKLKFNLGDWEFRFILILLNKINRQPGRLYSFVGYKP